MLAPVALMVELEETETWEKAGSRAVRHNRQTGRSKDFWDDDENKAGPRCNRRRPSPAEVQA